MSDPGTRWYQFRVTGTVAYTGMARGLLEVVARGLERSGLQTVGDLRTEAVGYRDAQPRVRALAQVGAPVLAGRVQEVRLWVESPGTLRYEASFRPEVFELLLLAWGTCLIIAASQMLLPGLAVAAVAPLFAVALVRATVGRQHRELHGWIESAVREARADSSTATETPLG